MPVSNNILAEFFNKKNLQIDQLRKQYYKYHFNIVDPIQYTLDVKAERSYQYVPLLKILHQLLNQNDVLVASEWSPLEDTYTSGNYS